MIKWFVKSGIAMLNRIAENFQGTFCQAFPVQVPVSENMIIWQSVCLDHGHYILGFQLAVGKGKGMKTCQRLLKKPCTICGNGGRINAAAQLRAKWVGSIQTALDGRLKLFPIGIYIFTGILQLEFRFC